VILQPPIIAQFFPLLAHCVVRYMYYIVYTTKYASPEIVHMLYIPKVFIFFSNIYTYYLLNLMYNNFLERNGDYLLKDMGSEMFE